MVSSSAYSQETNLADTLQAAIKIDGIRKIGREIDRFECNAPFIKGVASPLGEGDPIRWAQGLPGVTTGADGTASFYVRGGNMGNTLFSVDGVPVYGYSHLLGLTTIVPTQAIEKVSLTKGGFEGRENNFTTAHLKLVTRTPSEGIHAGASLNNFLFSAGSDGRIGQRFSYIVNVKVSPLSHEYRLVRERLPELLVGMNDFTAEVGDAYAKMRYDMGRSAWIEASGLGSIDDYTFSQASGTDESMSWDNLIGLLRGHTPLFRGDIDVSASINRYTSSQIQDKVYRGIENHLSLKSDLLEATFSINRQRKFKKAFTLEYGGKYRLARFKPGQVASITNETLSGLGTVYIQSDYTIPGKFETTLAIRENFYENLNDGIIQCAPEVSFSTKLHILPELSLEGSFDNLVQYYHTLEGLPVGWSLDMVIPSGAKVAPETSVQGSVGTVLNTNRHSAAIVGFYRHMENLVYYKYAQALFSGGMATWEDDVDQGMGDSYGAEFLYEYNHGDWYARTSYTLSRSTRYGFNNVMDGGLFHARFDRTHILNVFAEWKGISATFTLQSGNWENAAPEKYPMHTFGDEEWISRYFGGINNYHMPMILRLDLGYGFSLTSGKITHDFNLGICNVTNHFNPFMLYFDTSAETWKALALLPFFPNFSYRIAL